MLKEKISLLSSRRDLHQARWLFWLFLGSLGMFFLATLATYVIIRTQVSMPIRRIYEPLRLPVTFWVSTALMLVTSVMLERAVWFVRRERQRQFRQSLTVGAATGGAFLLVQFAAMSQLLVTHFSQIDGSTKFYGFTFMLALVHALHVIGGVVFLIYLIVRAHQDRIDHERYWSVTHCAGYWHFLDVVWISMLATFLVTG